MANFDLLEDANYTPDTPVVDPGPEPEKYEDVFRGTYTEEVPHGSPSPGGTLVGTNVGAVSELRETRSGTWTASGGYSNGTGVRLVSETTTKYRVDSQEVSHTAYGVTGTAEIIGRDIDAADLNRNISFDFVDESAGGEAARPIEGTYTYEVYHPATSGSGGSPGTASFLVPTGTIA